MEIRNYTANPVVSRLLCSIEKNTGSCACRREWPAAGLATFMRQISFLLLTRCPRFGILELES